MAPLHVVARLALSLLIRCQLNSPPYDHRNLFLQPINLDGNGKSANTLFAFEIFFGRVGTGTVQARIDVDAESERYYPIGASVLNFVFVVNKNSLLFPCLRNALTYTPQGIFACCKPITYVSPSLLSRQPASNMPRAHFDIRDFHALLCYRKTR